MSNILTDNNKENVIPFKELGISLIHKNMVNRKRMIRNKKSFIITFIRKIIKKHSKMYFHKAKKVKSNN
jgi:hypothetical protein